MEDLDEQRALGLEPATGKIHRQFGQVLHAGGVGDTHSAQVGGHVGQNKIHLLALQQGFELIEHGLLAKVTLKILDARDGVHGQHVQCDDATLHGNLGGLAAQVVGHAHVGSQIRRGQTPANHL